MIKHCQKFHFRISRHGFLISKHVRAARHGILAPALKAETSIYQFLLFDLSASWFVGELSSYLDSLYIMGQSSNGAPRRSAPMHLLLSIHVHNVEMSRAIVMVPFIVV